MMYLQPGTLLRGGAYKIVRFIASGGFGCTYEAQHIMQGKRVAIKEFFMKDSCNREESTNRVIVATKAKEEQVTRMKHKFIKEARALQNMLHPNIVHVENAFEENATAYYVMDYIEGTSLNDIIKVAGSLSEAKALDYIMQIADALRYVHSKNILHLDVKPGNVMVDKKGKAILIDFGASKQYDEVTGENTSTLLGINTTGYAPAEQSYRGFVQFAPSTDIYALGATLYKLLTGTTPPDAQMLKDGEAELAPLPSNISASVKNAVKESMRPLRKHRPQSIDDFLRNLDASDIAVTSTPTPSEAVDESTLVSIRPTVPDAITDNKTFYVHEVEETLAPETTSTTTPQELYEMGKKFYAQDKSKAFECYKKAAEYGHVEAQYELGYFYYLEGSEYGPFTWYKKAAEQGHSKAQYELAGCYYVGRGVTQDKAKAIELYIKLAEHGSTLSSQRIAWAYLCGNGVVQDEKKAIEWYTKAAEQGDKDSKRILKQIKDKDLDGLFHKAQSLYGDDEIGLLTYIAKLGHVGAQYELAGCYDFGRRVTRDKKKAAEWYSKAAEQGHSQAQYELARCYEFGRGVTRDKKKAAEWYSKAAEQGHSQAQYELGDWYESGLYGLKQDLYKAFELYSKAAEQGNQNALGRIKEIHKLLRNGPYARALQLYQNKQYNKGIKVLKKVAALPEAQYLLGECYFFGRGVPKDEHMAIEWYTKAAKQGNKAAKDMLAKINGNQSLESTSPKSTSSQKSDTQDEASKPKVETVAKVHDVDSNQQRKEYPTKSSNENKDANSIAGFFKKIFS